MSYTKTNWENGKTPINAVNLNKIEEGIANLEEGIANLEEGIANLEEETANMFNGFTQISSLTTNLGVNYYAQQLKYKKIGNMAFFYIIMNTKTVSTNTAEFYVEVPFKFSSDWYIPMISANNWSDTDTYYLRPEAGTNKIYLTTNHNRGKLKCNALHSGYIMDCQFFAFVE